MDNTPPNRYTSLTPRPAAGRRPAPYPTSPRMPEPPLKPTSSLRHRRQSSTAMSMSPTSCSDGSEFRESIDVETASRHLGEAMDQDEGKGVGLDGNTDHSEELSRISQAMTLLSLHPSRGGGVPLTETGHTLPSSTGLVPWPLPEELLKESLRQSLSALHVLSRIKSLVENFPNIGEARVEGEKGGIAQIMDHYDRAVSEMKAAGEALAWAQQYLSEEKEAVRERLLKG